MLLRTSLLMITACLISPTAFAAGSKKGKAAISFHLQADHGDAPKMIYPMMVSGKQMAFKRVADFQTDDIAGYKAIPSQTREGIYDIIIQFKPHAAKRLQAITNANLGKYMASQINGRPGEAMLINEQVNDGVLVIWGIATAEDLNILAKTFKGAVETQ